MTKEQIEQITLKQFIKNLKRPFADVAKEYNDLSLLVVQGLASFWPKEDLSYNARRKESIAMHNLNKLCAEENKL